jgi:hypothetical protein
MLPNSAELIAPCGMNCALCAAYLAMKNEVKSQGIKMPTCVGCRPRRKQCALLKKRCSKLLNSEVNFCFECEDFPCKRLIAIDERYKNHYRMSLIQNLSYIKRYSMDRFLEQQEQKWKCPNCNGNVCCHNGICFNCELDKLRAKKLKYRWEE